MRRRRRRTGGKGEKNRNNTAPQAPCERERRGTRSCWRCTVGVRFTKASFSTVCPGKRFVSPALDSVPSLKMVRSPLQWQLFGKRTTEAMQALRDTMQCAPPPRGAEIFWMYFLRGDKGKRRAKRAEKKMGCF
eukprot:gene15314-biopygen21702